MEFISIFDMLKIGVGPSSSHTLGPWRASQKFIKEIIDSKALSDVQSIKIELFGSLSLTGKGHATDIAVVLGLLNENPETIKTDSIAELIDSIKSTKKLNLNQTHLIPFDYNQDIVFLKNFLPFHSNALKFTVSLKDNNTFSSVFYSIGGGFVIKDSDNPSQSNATPNVPFPIQNATELLQYCKTNNRKISEIVLENEIAIRSEEEVNTYIKLIWKTMATCIYEGCQTGGILPGGLNVKRRAHEIYEKLGGPKTSTDLNDWLDQLRKTEVKFRQILKWVSCFGLAVNEVNASMGRVITAPTNGSAGVIPAVMLYYVMIENHEADFTHIRNFMLVASEIGCIFKKGSTISAAMGGCQAEIGVSAAMAAAGLCEIMGGSAEQVLIAAEIAMEHHLGLTCDPIAGLVQIPCIERNAIGALKAIQAAELALETDPKHAKVPLDKVVNTMWQTAQDMSHKYKETSTGGLAIAVNMADC
jgi:L-serine dehydratase